jgi:hypothetical protein
VWVKKKINLKEENAKIEHDAKKRTGEEKNQ